MEAKITRKPIKIVFGLTLLFLVRYIFVLGFENYSISDFSVQNTLSLLLSCAMAPIFSLLIALVLIKYLNPFSKASYFLLVLLIADPLPLSSIKNFSTLTAGVLFMLCILLIQRKAKKTITLLFVAVIFVAAAYIAPEMLFSLLPMTVTVCLAESDEVSAMGKVIAAATIILGSISAIVSSLYMDNGVFTRLRYYGARPIDFAFENSSVSSTLPQMFTVFIISAPVIIVTAYFSIKLISLIYKDGHGVKCCREVRAERSGVKASKNKSATKKTNKKKALQNKKKQKQKTTVQKKSKQNKEKSVVSNRRIRQNKHYVWRLALIVCPVLICIIGRIVFGNSGVIVASLNITPLLILLTFKTNGDKYMQPLFDDFEQIITKHSLVTVISAIYLAGCTAYAVDTQSSFSGGMNGLFRQITHYLI